MEEKKVLTVTEVSEQLRISRSLVYRQIKQGVIPAVRVGDRYLVSVVAFNKWLENVGLNI